MACAEACCSCDEDDASWFTKKATRDCAWVAKKKTKSRCKEERGEGQGQGRLPRRVLWHVMCKLVVVVVVVVVVVFWPVDLVV